MLENRHQTLLTSLIFHGGPVGDAGAGAISVISYLNATPDQQGLLAVPCICGQIAQVFIGSAMAPYIADKVKKSKVSLPAEDGELPG
jgi:hypothetical protein